MADVTQNISAQLFVKELPAANRADFTGCKQDFDSPNFTTCVNNVDSDVAVENAFQSQLSLSEYYKSPQVFNTIKNNYMSQTIEGHFETEQVNLTPQRSMPPEVSSATMNADLKTVFKGKESFGNISSANTLLLIIAAIAIGIFIYKKKG